MHPDLKGIWIEGIRLLVSEAIQGGGDNYHVVTTLKRDRAFRLFVSRIVTYVSQQTEIHIYIIEMKTKDYGDEDTTRLLRAVSLGLRFRFLVLEEKSEFTPAKLSFPVITREMLMSKVTELLAQMNVILRDSQTAGLAEPSLLQIIWGDDGATKVGQLMAIWNDAHSDLYTKAHQLLACATDDFEERREKFLRALHAFCDQTEEMNREYTSRALHALAERTTSLIERPIPPRASLDGSKNRDLRGDVAAGGG